eukprot:6558855-Pyramimonas_sp.AAC.1
MLGLKISALDSTTTRREGGLQCPAAWNATRARLNARLEHEEQTGLERVPRDARAAPSQRQAWGRMGHEWAMHPGLL